MVTSTRTKFRDMSDQQRAYWKAWADAHDWGQDNNTAYYNNGLLYTFTAEHDGHEWQQVCQGHSTPKEMREWAGY